MTNPEQKVLDDIDDLVDWQMAQESSGYDHNINQPKCRCGEDWHALPITEALKVMRFRYRYSGVYDETYDHATDSSPVLCPGSEVEGPLRARGMAFCGCVLCQQRRHPRADPWERAYSRYRTSGSSPWPMPNLPDPIFAAASLPWPTLVDLNRMTSYANPVLDRLGEQLGNELFRELMRVLLGVNDTITRIQSRQVYVRPGGTYSYGVFDEGLGRDECGDREVSDDFSGFVAPSRWPTPDAGGDDPLARLRRGDLDPDGPIRTYRTVYTRNVETDAQPEVGLPVDVPVRPASRPMWVSDPWAIDRRRSVRDRKYQA
ncbi:MAG: hypothetical protein WBF79_00640 [Rhodococcus sp. (in: high G+C Gram-positive bacteria)]